MLELHERRYILPDFAAYTPRPSARSQPQRTNNTTRYIPNADLMTCVTDELNRRGGKLRGNWINGVCPFPERHKHGDQHPSFGFNTRTGYGFCHVCGTLLLKDLCPALGISPVY